MLKYRWKFYLEEYLHTFRKHHLPLELTRVTVNLMAEATRSRWDLASKCAPGNLTTVGKVKAWTRFRMASQLIPQDTFGLFAVWTWKQPGTDSENHLINCRHQLEHLIQWVWITVIKLLRAFFFFFVLMADLSMKKHICTVHITKAIKKCSK